ncbi:Phosphoglucomutase-3 [Tulasnella sp. 418]|nr:Phosphoglucomutase-3 [Tulasnella sp. 418]
MSTQALVQEWLRLDQNPTTRDEIAQLATNGNETELRKRLATRIEFGTAGLRGRMEAGFSRMNDLTVIQASQGLCAYVLQHVGDAKEKGVVIGHDHRHHSERWALLTATAFVARGMKAYLHRGLVHTPLVPFSVKRLGAACGVMITASHNPKNDNGYKVYWGNGVQIIEPHDKGIASSIKENLEPGVDAWKTDGLLENPLCIDRTEDMIRLYLTHLASFSYTRELNVTTDVTFVNTSMHGVGNRFAAKAFEVYGLRPYLPVEPQMEPDPDFPTVAFPNPEEHGALKLALETAGNHKADYVLAQDPDADRFTAAERGSDGTWTQFSGDQLGTLLAAWTLLKYQASGEPIEKLAMVASTVSSKMIGGMATREGFKFTESLTGFKYIGNTALDLQAKGFSVPFGYEEAIGFMIGDEIRDKDGVNATVGFASIISVHVGVTSCQ